jgi:GT2 family glycosyltransferase
VPEHDKQPRVAVLITCHNRVAHTTACLEALRQQEGFTSEIDLFIVDDGSTDGTGQAIRQIYPGARLLKGDGSLYWAGGTRWAFAEAMREDYDFYLWLNDDTRLKKDAMAQIYATYTDARASLGDLVIVIGSTCEEGRDELSYGGWEVSRGKFSLMRWYKTAPASGHWTTCDTMNGNCVLLPRAVVNLVGNIDPGFTHGMGDMDYGLRARQAGCQIVVAPGFHGYCSANDGTGLWTDATLPLRERWQRMLGPKGLPLREWRLFTRRHAGALWMINWMWPYARFWGNALFRSLKVGKQSARTD